MLEGIAFAKLSVWDTVLAILNIVLAILQKALGILDEGFAKLGLVSVGNATQ